MALSYLTYYLAGFLWGFYTDNFFLSSTVLAYFQVAFYFIFGKGAVTDSEFWVWLPLSATFGLIVAVCLKRILRAPCFFSHALFCNEPYIIKLVVQLLLLHSFLIFWEVLPSSPLAWGGIIEFVFFFAAIIVIYVLNKYDIITANKNFNETHLKTLFFYWALLFLPVIALFTIVISVTQSFWPFWLSLISFAVSVVVLVLMEFFIPAN